MPTITLADYPLDAQPTHPEFSVPCCANSDERVADRLAYILDHARRLGITAVRFEPRPGDNYDGMREQVKRAQAMGIWLWALCAHWRECGFNADTILASMKRFVAETGCTPEAWMLNEPWHDDIKKAGIDWRVLYDRLVAGTHRLGLGSCFIGCEHGAPDKWTYYGQSAPARDVHLYVGPPGAPRVTPRPGGLLHIQDASYTSVNRLAGRRWSVHAYGPTPDERTPDPSLTVRIGNTPIVTLRGTGYRGDIAENIHLTGTCTVEAVGSWQTVRVALALPGVPVGSSNTFRFVQGVKWMPERVREHALRLHELTSVWPSLYVSEGGCPYHGHMPGTGCLADAMLWAASYGLAAHAGVLLVGWHGRLDMIENTPLWWVMDCLSAMRGERLMLAECDDARIRCVATDRHVLVVNTGESQDVVVERMQRCDDAEAAFWQIYDNDPCCAWSLPAAGYDSGIVAGLLVVRCRTGLTFVEMGR